MDGQVQAAGQGVFAQVGMDPPLNAIFAQVRDIWVAQAPPGEARSYSALSTMLSEYIVAGGGMAVAPQNVSQWATGSDGRRPPWHVVMLLCSLTGYRLVATVAEWRVEPLPSGEREA